MAMKFAAAQLAKLKANLERNVAQGQPPGLVAWISRAGEQHALPVGALSIGGPPMPRDAIFRIASMTKPITAVAAMVLVEEGKLRLDEPIDELAPELAARRVLKSMSSALDDTVAAHRPITLEDVLTFRLGWGMDFNEDAPFVRAAASLPGFGMPNPAWSGDDDTFLQALSRLPLQAQPGERWLYTLGANVLGVLVARASRQPLDVFLQERIFEPLKMSDTAFYVPAGKLGRLVTGYVNNDGMLAPFDPWNRLYAKRPSFLAGDSGLVSTADDYGTFARFMFNGTTPGGRRLLQVDTLRDMTTNQLSSEQIKAGELILGPGRGWGLGIGVQVTTSPYGVQPGAYGWEGGFGTSWFNDPTHGLTAMLLTQRAFDSPDPPSVHKQFWQDAYAAAV
jgi:CubicO group peptidase (beta-lactamase class C family)